MLNFDIGAAGAALPKDANSATAATAEAVVFEENIMPGVQETGRVRT